MGRIRSFLVVFIIILWIAILTLNAFSAEQPAKFPTKNITFIITTSPGGGTDTYARLITPYMEKYLPNQRNILVKNIPGAEHALGINACLRAAPDGHTWVTVLLPGENLSQLLGLAKFELKELAFIGAVTQIPNLFTISAKRPERSLKELQEAGKRNPLKCGSPGLATPAGSGSVIAAQILGIKTQFITHQGGAPAVLATIRGDCDYTVQGYPVLKSAIENGQLVPLWVYSDKRFGHLPNVPTIVEMGYPQLVSPLVMYYGAALSLKVPEEIRNIVAIAYKKSVEDPGFARLMEKAGSYAIYTSPEEMMAVVKNSNELYIKYRSLLEESR